MGTRLNYKLILLLFLIVSGPAFAGTVTYQDTLRPVADGIATEWSIYPTGVDHYENIDDVTSDGDDTYVFASTANTEDSWDFVTGSCPDDWTYYPGIDSVVHYVVAKRYAVSEEFRFGQGYNNEGTFAFCDFVDSLTPTTDYELYSVCYDANECDDAWTAYNLMDNVEWGIATNASVAKGASFRVTQEYIVLYRQFADSAEILTVEASLCSTWSVYSCDDVAECLTSQVCDDIRINLKDSIQAWTMSTYSDPEGTEIDSVEIRLTAFAASSSLDSVIVFYVTESSGVCTQYGIDTIPDIYYAAQYGGPEHSVVWTTCPATGSAWTASDLTDSDKGFGIASLHDSYIAVTWFVAIVYYSAEEVAGLEHRLIRIVDDMELLKIVNSHELAKIVGEQNPRIEQNIWRVW